MKEQILNYFFDEDETKEKEMFSLIMFRLAPISIVLTTLIHFFN